MPDIAADADFHTGMLIGLTFGTPAHYTEGADGGTSLATPLIAGIQADAQQAQHGVPLGFADPAIYARYLTPAYRDITDTPPGVSLPIANADDGFQSPGATSPYSVVTFAHDTSLHATPGDDDLTGVGTPTAAYLNSYRQP